VGPRASLDVMVRRKKSLPLLGIKLVAQPVIWIINSSNGQPITGID